MMHVLQKTLLLETCGAQLRLTMMGYTYQEEDIMGIAALNALLKARYK